MGDLKTSPRPASERVSWCLELPLLGLPSQDRFPSLTLLSLFLSFIFCPTSFLRQWAAFPGAWCLLLMIRSCFVEFAQRSNVLLMNLWGRKSCSRPVLFLRHLNSSFATCIFNKYLFAFIFTRKVSMWLRYVNEFRNQFLIESNILSCFEWC